MLVKYKLEHVINFEDFNYYELQNQILKDVNQKYPTNDFTLESIELCGDKYYSGYTNTIKYQRIWNRQ